MVPVVWSRSPQGAARPPLAPALAGDSQGIALRGTTLLGSRAPAASSQAAWLLGCGLPLSIGLGQGIQPWRGVRNGASNAKASGSRGRLSHRNVGALRPTRCTRVVMRSCGSEHPVQADNLESTEEAMLRLTAEIKQALEVNNLAAAANAQREMRHLQLDRPSAACRLLILEDCQEANKLIWLGDDVPVKARLRAVRKLGRWLRWRRNDAKGLVPAATALEGLLWALRSEPEVAWMAQCALFHAVRCTDGAGQSVRDGTRGTVSRLLLNEPTPFPMCLPKADPRIAAKYEEALRTSVVHDFFTQLRALTLIDPGYGDAIDCEDMDFLQLFARLLGHSFDSLERLRILGFEDYAMVLILPHLALPRLKSLQITGDCQTELAQSAITACLRRRVQSLVELELNIWTDFLCEAEDPLVDIGVMPEVRYLAVRAPPPVPWGHFAECFPRLEQLSFLYDQDFALDSMEVLHGCDEEEQEDQLGKHALWTYREAVIFARDLHSRGFRCLAKQCPNLKEVRLVVSDTSFGLAVELPEEDRLILSWQRDSKGGTNHPFPRVAAWNNETRSKLASASMALASNPGAEVPPEEEDGDSSDDDFGEEEHVEVAEERAAAAGAFAMLQVVRLFDDPSLEAQLGL